MSERFDDLIVVIPGIIGSVLERDGRPVWDLSLAAMRRVLPPGGLVEGLRLGGKGTVTAPRIIRGLHVIPGLWGIDGYGPLLDHLARVFDVSRGNLVEFPYDWRLSCQVNACRLEATVQRELLRWRETVPGAKVVFVCHSMGGLIARYYLEVLGGREIARGLVTIGTPHQGAAKAAAALSLGLAPGIRSRLGRFGAVLDELRDVVATFRSVHELLPTYRCVDRGNGDLRTLADAGLPDVPTESVRHGAAFHQDILDAVTANGPAPYGLWTFGGHGQPTTLSIRHDAAGLAALPTWNGENPRGDGTVPRFASVPPEFQDDGQVRFSGDRHAALAGARPLLHALHAILTATPVRKYQATVEDVLSLDIPELVPVGEPAEVAVTTGSDRLPLAVTAEHDETGAKVAAPTMRNHGGGRYHTTVTLPRPGPWRLTVKPAVPAGLEPVTEIMVAVATL
ncbi:esterase/lipase family protein [Sphaerisporangium aureirubrum]|uniref:Esterase/lipase family protein n=1 Tax=Sphaerisporangium aureirubrum TaxID=1544736 RepID=A0ABW1N9C7_9ACTN